MPAAVAIPAIASVIGGGLAFAGSKSAQHSQEKSGAAALAFEREREQRRQFEYDQAERQRREQYEGEQRRAAPFRLAAASVLAKYGIQVPLDQEQPPAEQMGSDWDAPPEVYGGQPPMSLGAIMSRGTYAR